MIPGEAPEDGALHELIDGATHDGQISGAMRWTPRIPRPRDGEA